MRAVLLFLVLLSACVEGNEARSGESVPTPNFPDSWSWEHADFVDGKRVERRQVAVAQPAPAVEQQPAPPPRAAAATPFGKSPLVAVLEIRSRLKGADAEAADPLYFTDEVRASIKRAMPGARLMTRENIIVLLKSQGKTMAECEGECEVDTGRRLGADLVVSGDLLRIGKNYKLDLRVHETHEGQLLNGVAASGGSIEELDRNTLPAVKSLMSPEP